MNKPQKLDEILTCFICLSNLQNPHICPCCSKLCCYSCIFKWLAENRQCPHCRSSLRSQQLVNCRFLEEIQQTIVQINDPCPSHHAQLQYYCITCSTPICSECAMFSGHKMHEFEHIQKVFDSKIKVVKQNLEPINERLRTLKDQSIQVDELVDELNRSKDERVQEIHQYTELQLARLEQQHQSRLMVLQLQKQVLTTKILNVSNELEDVQFNIKNLQKSQTIIKAEELLQRVQNIQAEPELVGGVSLQFKSEVVPPYVEDTFELVGFADSEEIIYSDHMVHNGIKWRLKLYPHGNGNAKNQYVSVFLEMDSKFTDSRRYEYKIEMLNQVDGPNVIREFSSEFEGGECWGYNRFFRIDLLLKDGYLVDDRLLFKYYVRAPNYYIECLDMQRYIRHLELDESQTVRKMENHSSIQKLKQEIESYAEKVEQLDEEQQSDSSGSEYYFDGQFEEIQAKDQPIRRNLFRKFNQISSKKISPENRSPLSELNDNLYL